MKKSNFISLLLFFYVALLFGQEQINNYKYILVPKRYDFQKSDDQYQLNSLTKFLFNKAGYSVFLSDESLPQELASNACLGLRALIVNNSNMFTTKVKIDLIDCYNNVVFSTAEGISKEKDYSKGYQEAIRNAFIELEEFKYNFNGGAALIAKSVDEKVNTSPLIEIESAKEPIIELPKIATPLSINSNKGIEEPIEKLAIKPVKSTLEGNYNFDNYGTGSIKKVGAEYSLIVGDERVEIAQIYQTSKEAFFIIKWAAFKQPQLMELDGDGNLLVDQNNGNVTVYKRRN